MNYSAVRRRRPTNARGSQPKREVQQVLLLVGGARQGLVDGGRQDDVAGGASEGALARALQVHAVGVRYHHQVLAHPPLHRQLLAVLVHKTELYPAGGQEWGERKRGARCAAVSVAAPRATLTYTGASSGVLSVNERDGAALRTPTLPRPCVADAAATAAARPRVDAAPAAARQPATTPALPGSSRAAAATRRPPAAVAILLCLVDWLLLVVLALVLVLALLSAAHGVSFSAAAAAAAAVVGVHSGTPPAELPATGYAPSFTPFRRVRAPNMTRIHSLMPLAAGYTVYNCVSVLTPRFHACSTSAPPVGCHVQCTRCTRRTVLFVHMEKTVGRGDRQCTINNATEAAWNTVTTQRRTRRCSIAHSCLTVAVFLRGCSFASTYNPVGSPLRQEFWLPAFTGQLATSKPTRPVNQHIHHPATYDAVSLIVYHPLCLCLPAATLVAASLLRLHQPPPTTADSRRGTTQQAALQPWSGRRQQRRHWRRGGWVACLA